MEIVKFREMQKGTLLGFFSLKLPKWGNLIINDLSLFSKNGHRWISFPARQYESNGEKKYASYLIFEEKETMVKFQDEVLKALDKHLAQQQPQPPKQEKTVPQYVEEPLPF